MNVTLKPAKSLMDWCKVLILYRQAFPPSERKPFRVIYQMARENKVDVWMVLQCSHFCGFATTINSPELVLLDYLAMKKLTRGQGLGTAALKQLMDRYKDRGFFVEIEDPFDPVPDLRDRQRRRAFYRACGLEPLRVMALVFGVKMELLGKNCSLDFAGYRDFYVQHYSPRAADNLIQVPHPESYEKLLSR